MNAEIVIENLTIKAGKQRLVDGLSLTLKQGETLTVLGETGAGKSVLAQAILGDLPVGFSVSGSVTVNGLDMLRMSAQSRRKLWGRTMVMLPQEPWQALSPLKTILQQVAEVGRCLFAKPKKLALQHARQSLADLGLQSALNKVPAQISGGMAQRTVFACAQATGASILLADEPTKGLDTACRDDLVAQLQYHASTGTLLTITHDVEVARQLGGNIVVMRQGCVEETGRADEVLANPASDYGQEFLRAAPQHWPDASHTNAAFADLVTIKNLSIERGQQTLFSNLQLVLGEGEVVGFYGPSGCGKTSLADALLGLLSCRGDIHFHQPLLRHQKLKLYQDPPSAFAAHVPLLSLLEDVLKRHNISRDRIGPMCRELGLAQSLLNRTVQQVSGGELQRIALLRALLLRPKLLVADEPTSRLDPITSRNITQLLIAKCREMHCTLIFISHDRVQLEKVCHRIIDVACL